MQKEKYSVPQLRFPEFIGEWKESSMTKLYPKIRNGFVGVATPYYRETGIKYLQGKNIKNNRIGDNDIIYIDECFHKKKINSLLKENDILMVQSGHVGECAVVTREYENSNCHALLVATPSLEANSNFYVYYFYTSIGKQKLFKITTGNTIKHILSSDLKSIRVPFPKLDEQQKIASFLIAIDIRLQNLEKKKSLLVQYKKGVMQQIFKQKIRFKDDDGNDFSEWDFKKGNLLFQSISDKNHNSDLPILAVTQDQGAIPRDEINYNIGVTAKSVSSYKVVQKGDFIISLRSFQGGIEYSSYKGICSPAYIILRPIKDIDRDFYRYYLKTPSYIGELVKKLEGIRDGKMVSYKYFSEIKLPYPSIEEQTKIANFLIAIDKKIGLVEKQIEKTKTYKKGLLQQMFG